jgi:hypothetical protein
MIRIVGVLPKKSSSFSAERSQSFNRGKKSCCVCPKLDAALELEAVFVCLCRDFDSEGEGAYTRTKIMPWTLISPFLPPSGFPRRTVIFSAAASGIPSNRVLRRFASILLVKPRFSISVSATSHPREQ